MIARFSDTPEDRTAVGTDGCGVPVFGVPLWRIAQSYARLMHPEVLGDSALTEAVAYDRQCIHAFPEKINDFGTPTCLLNADENYIAKDGARGIWCVGLKKERIGIAVKLEDGYDTMLHGLLIARILQQLGVGGEMADALIRCVRMEITNDNGVTVGRFESHFSLE